MLVGSKQQTNGKKEKENQRAEEIRGSRDVWSVEAFGSVGPWHRSINQSKFMWHICRSGSCTVCTLTLQLAWRVHRCFRAQPRRILYAAIKQFGVQLPIKCCSYTLYAAAGWQCAMRIYRLNSLILFFYLRVHSWTPIG